MNLDEMSQRSGQDGAVGRLLQRLEMRRIQDWVNDEMRRGTPAMELGPAFGRALAGQAAFFAGFFDDRDAVLTNRDSGVCACFSRSLERMAVAGGLDRTRGGVVVPPTGVS